MSSFTAANPSVSLVLFCFNQEEFIEDAVRSVLGQQCDPIDILISDDCSTDRTFETARAVVQDYRGPHRVRLNRNEVNMGISAHFTKCVEEVTTDWVVVAAGDDISECNRVSTIYDIIQRFPSIDGIGSAFDSIDQSGKSIAGHAALYRRVKIRAARLLVRDMTDHARLPDDRLRRYIIEGRPLLSGATAAWRRRLITHYPPIAANAPEDPVLRMRAVIGGGVFVSRKRLVRYRTHSHNAWSANSKGLTAEQTEQHRQRQIKLRRAGLTQHITDLEAKEAIERISPALRHEAVHLLRTRCVLAEVEVSPSPDFSRTLGKYLLHLGLNVRQAAISKGRWRQLEIRKLSLLRALMMRLLGE